jgi:four helix bundle protein
MKTNSFLERLICFANNINDRFKPLEDLRAHENLISQINRSSSSAELNYSESLLSSTDRDYANKVRISLKEMNETCTILKMIEPRLLGMIGELADLRAEADELTAILSTCCRKAEAKFKK